MIQMLLGVFLILLGTQPSRAVPFPSQYTLTDTLSNVTINFDDFPTSSKGLGNISSTNITYEHLQFTNFTVLHTPDAYKHGLLPHRHEVLCAASAPNALFSSNFQSYLNNTGTSKSQLSLNSTAGGPVLFNLVALNLAPLGITPPFPNNIVVRANLYLVDDGAWQYEAGFAAGFGAGLHESIKLPLREIFGEQWGRSVNLMEVWAEQLSDTDVPDREWGFCMDDLVLEWVYP